MRALLAFDKFKDSLSAFTACQAVARALGASTRADQLIVDECPLADGGEGFAEILTRSTQGTLEQISVRGPRGQTVAASLGFVTIDRIPASAVARLALPSGLPKTALIAVIEMAAASGLALLPPDQRDPWLASSHGTGELIRTAAQRGVAAILLGVGGSATNDLGLGALAALGFAFHDAAGNAPVATDSHRLRRQQSPARPTRSHRGLRTAKGSEAIGL
jgi:glycerate kinase